MRRGLVAFLAILALTSGCSHDTEITPPKPSVTADQDAEAADAVARLQRVLVRHDTKAMAQTRALSDAVANARTLRLRILSVRYVEPAELAAEDLAGVPSGTFGATVEMGYRLSGWDPRPTRLETTVLLHRTGGQTTVVGFAPGTGRLPLWLSGPLSIVAEGRVLVIDRSDDPRLAGNTLARLARVAVREDARTLGWNGRLVVEVPDSETALEQALEATAGQYANIAAVTTTVDGSAGRTAPLHVFLNPAVFSRLGHQGAQVVMTHESVHVATRANASKAPDWVREGFADYVALLHAGVPISEAGAQAIAQARKQGPPKHLPTDAELAASAPGLGTTYEEAWLVCRTIGQRYGTAKLIALYEALDSGTPLAAALNRVLGIDQRELVAEWSHDVARLAR